MIYCVEDDQSIRDLMIYTLNSAGFQAKGISGASQLAEAMKSEKPLLILLDLMLPGEDGITILKKLKSQAASADIPVIIASAKGTEYDKVIGLDLGADDYLAKPFGMMEMLSRVKAVLRRTMPKQPDSTLAVGGLELCPAEHTVYIKNGISADNDIHNASYKIQIQLTLKEYELLRLFMEHPGMVFTRDTLLEKIWEFDYAGGTRTVDVHVGTLRTKLGACGSYIKTVRGVGYKMEDHL